MVVYINYCRAINVHIYRNLVKKYSDGVTMYEMNILRYG